MDEWTIVLGGVAALVVIGLAIGIAALAADETEAPPRAAGLKQDQHVVVRRARIRRLQQEAERDGLAYWNQEPPDA